MGYAARALLAIAQGSPGPDLLASQGIELPVTIVAHATGQQTDLMAQLDTGSTISGVDQGVLQNLGASVIGSLPIGTPSGDVTDSLYDASIVYQGEDLTAGLPGGVLGEDLPPPDQALIGRDILRRWEVVYDGQTGTWSILSRTVAPVASTSEKALVGVGLILLGIGAAVAFRDAERAHKRLVSPRGRRAA